jgi:hypothetical protein
MIEKYNFIGTRLCKIRLFFSFFGYELCNMKESIIKQCLDILKTEDVRKEIKVLFSPVTDIILYEIYPYIYLIIFLVFLIFIFILAILILLVTILRSKISIPIKSV